MSDPHWLLEEVIEIAGRAADRIETAPRIVVEEKEPGHPLAAADREVDAFLRERLLDLEPCGWLSEETADSPARLSERRVWIVDPIDGTKEFLAGIPEYSVSIALVEDQQPVLGVVMHPPTRRVFHAVRGDGAQADGNCLETRDGDRLLASRTEVKRGEFHPFQEDWRIEPCGSIALKLARVAAGEAALTLSRRRKYEWDVCAGALIVEEAGGIVTDRFGARFTFNTPDARADGVIAGTIRACQQARRTIDRLQRADVSSVSRRDT